MWKSNSWCGIWLREFSSFVWLSIHIWFLFLAVQHYSRWAHLYYSWINNIYLISDQADIKNVYRRLTHLRSTSDTSQKFRHGGFLSFGKNVDLVDSYAKKLETLEENLRLEQSGVSMAGEVCLFFHISIKLSL